MHAEVFCMRFHSILLASATLVLAAPHGRAQGADAGSNHTPATQENGSGPPVPKARDLNSAFIIAPEQYRDLISRGTDMAKKGRKPNDVLNKYGKAPLWVRGGHGRANGRVWTLSFDGGFVLYEAYRAARTYEQVPFGDRAASHGLYVSELRFDVCLISAPKVGKNEWSQLFAGLAGVADPSNAAKYLNRVPDTLLKSADAAEVRAVKFVISDDEGNNFAAEGAGQVSSGTVTYSGVKALESSGQVTTNATGSANVSGTGGSATVTSTGYSQSVFTQTEFIPYSSEHQYYQARYDVHFPLFDERGTPRFSQNVRRLTLRIITDGGELDVEYKLPEARANAAH
jgi:hypothetical protein